MCPRRDTAAPGPKPQRSTPGRWFSHRPLLRPRFDRPARRAIAISAGPPPWFFPLSYTRTLPRTVRLGGALVVVVGGWGAKRSYSMDAANDRSEPLLPVSADCTNVFFLPTEQAPDGFNRMSDLNLFAGRHHSAIRDLKTPRR